MSNPPYCKYAHKSKDVWQDLIFCLLHAPPSLPLCPKRSGKEVRKREREGRQNMKKARQIFTRPPVNWYLSRIPTNSRRKSRKIFCPHDVVLIVVPSFHLSLTTSSPPPENSKFYSRAPNCYMFDEIDWERELVVFVSSFLSLLLLFRPRKKRGIDIDGPFLP